MYLVGTFERSEFSDGKLSLVGIVTNIGKDRLLKCRQDENYQVINLETREYYNAQEK